MPLGICLIQYDQQYSHYDLNWRFMEKNIINKNEPMIRNDADNFVEQISPAKVPQQNDNYFLHKL